MPQNHEIDDSSTLSLVFGYQQMFIFRYISFFFSVFWDNGDADPSREHLIAYGPPFRLQTLQNPGKPGETQGNRDTGRPHKIEPWRSKLDFLDF